MSSLAESLFLFVWALMSNTKELVLDYGTEIYENLIEQSVFKRYKRKMSRKERDMRRRLKRERRRRKRAYFKNFRAQLGKFDNTQQLSAGVNDNGSADSQAMAALNVLNALDNIGGGSSLSPGSNKLDSLENELMMLKMELETIARTGGKVAKSPLPHRNADAASFPPPPPPPPMPPSMALGSRAPVMGSMPPPPPPALPSHLLATAATKNSAAHPRPVFDLSNIPKLRPVKKEDIPPKPLSIADIVKSARGIQLKSTNDLKRSPGGTPMKPKNSGGGNRGCFQDELFAAIKNKFKSMHDDGRSPVRHGIFNSDDEAGEEQSDSDSDFSFSPVRAPLTARRAPAASPLSTPKRQGNRMMKQKADEEVHAGEGFGAQDKENTPTKNSVQLSKVASFIEKFNNQRQPHQAASPHFPRSPLRQVNA